MRLIVAVLCLAALSGCLRGLEDGFGGQSAPDPYVMPALAEATIRPGAALGGGGCTGNFLFLDADGGTVYIGTAAHCVSEDLDPETPTASSGCDTTRYRPEAPGTVVVSVEGAARPATLAYNSWYTMQERGETSVAACGANDFALLRLDPEDAAMAHPQMYGFGGPTGIATDESAGDVIHTHGATTLRPGGALDDRQGIIAEAGGWTHTTFQLTPGLPGDSGSPVVRDDGAAVGILVTLGFAPLPLSNGITDLGLALEYANREGNMNVSLITA